MDLDLFFEAVARKRELLLAIVLAPDDHEALKEHVKTFTYLQQEWKAGDQFMGVPVITRKHRNGFSALIYEEIDGFRVEILP